MKLNRSSVLTILPLALAASTCAAEYRISGPHTHANLAVFLIHGSNQTAKKFLTLQEALQQHKVVVYETGSVNQLAIENVSADEDVYIQSGEIVKGGQQDRTLKDDLILPTKSGKVPIASFCVEHGRWSRRGQEAVRNFDSAPQAVASKEMKMAVRVAGISSRSGMKWCGRRTGWKPWPVRYARPLRRPATCYPWKVRNCWSPWTAISGNCRQRRTVNRT